MAIWQFDLQLMQDQIVPGAPVWIDSAISGDCLDTTNWWQANQPDDDYRQIIANEFAPLDSWCQKIFRWGDEDLVLVEAFIADGQLSGIGIRVDVRNIDGESFDRMIQLATKLDCHFFVMESRQIVTPDVESLLQHLANSSAVEFVRDPKGFIERVARKNAK